MKRALSMALGLVLATSAFAADSLDFVMMRQGKQAGHLKVSSDGANGYQSDFYFKDNGRGPEIKEKFSLAGNGTLDRLDVAGKSTFGSAVSETFSRTDGKAHWKTNFDSGHADHAGDALYWSASGVNSLAAAIRILGGNPDRKLPLLPSGELSLRKLADATVNDGKAAKAVQLVAVSGVGLQPSLIWIDAGAKPELFAQIGSAEDFLIRKGWQGNGAALHAQQIKVERQFLHDLSKQLAHAIPGTTLIRNARVFDSENAVLLPASNVLIRDGKVAALDAAADTAAERVIDAGNRVMLPGLWDMHTHAGRWDGALFVAAGVTNVRDMGNNNTELQEMIGEQKSGAVILPHIVPAGFIEGQSPMSSRNGFVINDLAEAKQAVDWYAAHGYPQIKIYNSFPKAIVGDVIKYAHSKNLRVSGHVPVFMRAQDVIDLGYDELTHLNQFMLNFLVDGKTDTRTLARIYLPAEKTGTFDFDGKPMQDFIALLARKQIVVDPTIAILDILHHRDGTLSEVFASSADHFPPDVQRDFRQSAVNIPDDATAQRYDQSYRKLVELIGRLYRAGVPLVAGTDRGPSGFTLQHELERYVDAGVPAADVLRIATWNGAKYSKVLDRRGSIAVGKDADFLLVDGNPLEKISDIRKVALVVSGTRAYLPSEVYGNFGIKPFAEPVALP